MRVSSIRQWTFKLGIACVISLVVAPVLRAQVAAPPGTLLWQTFENGSNLWRAVGPEAKISIIHETENVKDGQSALRFDYSVEKDKLNSLVLPTPGGIPLLAKSFSFWIKADYATTLIMLLPERNGGRYTALFAVPAHAWQQVALAPADFILSEDKGDPKDPDNKLDLDQVQAIAIEDLKSFFAQSPNADVLKLFGVKTGPHTFYLDDFSVRETALPDAFNKVNGTVNLDLFEHPQLSWLTLGAVQITQSTIKGQNNTPDSQAIQATYRQAPGMVAGIARRLPRGLLAGMSHLLCNVASLHPATLLVQVEARDGGKYNTVVEVAGGDQPKAINLAFSDFKAAADAKDVNGHLDLEQVQQLLILDTTETLPRTQEENNLKLSQLRATAQ